MKKVKVDQRKRKALVKNFKALVFLSCFLLPFSLNAKTKGIGRAGGSAPAIWS